MADETEQKIVLVSKKPLSQDELQAIWQQDEYWGQGGSYDCDPFTGKRTPRED
ncbi:MAG: hypothetical protein WBI40_09320 [Methylococcaceae bacterium]|jgi:hypothetical protein